MTLSDPGDRTNELLSKILAIQANASGVTQASTAAEERKSGPSGAQIHWVNGLWFSALACSLSTALISMLAKQWLHAYTRNISGSPRTRARKRQDRFIRFRSWHVLTVINSLPLLLHAALLFFFCGVIVLLWTDEFGISLATIIIVALAFAFYTASMWISLISPDCPYQHPISEHLHHWLKPGRNWYKVCASKPPPPKSDLESAGLTEDFWEKE